MGTHAIIVIKNEKEQYLQYYDEKWESFLFLNCRLPNGEDENIVKERISEQLNIEKRLIEISYVGKKQHKKFSESAKIEKEYIHYFYNVKLNTKLASTEFELNGKNYKWFSYLDLKNDKRIQKVNGDIVQFIKEFNI